MSRLTMKLTAEQWLDVERRFAKLQVAERALQARLRLVDPTPEFERAGGDCLCPTCLLPYRDHPTHPDPTFHVVCDGSVVKL
jgi:hypothetical protein